MNTILKTQLNGYEVIRTQEQNDTQAKDGIRNRQFKIRIKKGIKTIKNSYFSNKRDRDIAYKCIIKVIEEGV